MDPKYTDEQKLAIIEMLLAAKELNRMIDITQAKKALEVAERISSKVDFYKDRRNNK